jgi:hypothetical protein
MNDLERRMDNVDLNRGRGASVGEYNRKQTATHTRPPLLILTIYHLPSGSPYQTPIAPPSPNMGITNLGYPPTQAAGYPPPSNYASGHDIYRAPSPYRGAPEPAILSRSRAPSPNPMGGPGSAGGIYGQRAPSPNPMGGPGPGVYGQRAPSPSPGAMYGNRSRAPSPIPGAGHPPAQYSQPLNRSRAPSPLPGAPPPPYGQPTFQYSNALPRSPRVGGGAPLEPQMLPPPDGFSRPANLAQSYTFFDTMKIQDMDDFYDNMPRMPKVLVPHDVYHEDWIRFIQVGFTRFFSFFTHHG